MRAFLILDDRALRRTKRDVRQQAALETDPEGDVGAIRPHMHPDEPIVSDDKELGGLRQALTYPLTQRPRGRES